MAHASARVPSQLPTPTPSPSPASTLTSSPDPSELSVETISDLVDPSPLPSPLPFHTSARDYLDAPSGPLPPPFPPFCPPLVTPPPASLPSSPPIPCTPVTHPPPLRPPQRIPSPRWPPPLLPPAPRPPPPLSFCVAAQHLSAIPTSSASFLLLGTENSTRAWPCFPAPFQVFVERANGEKEVLPILGRSLPLEISVVECHAGCSFQLRSLNAREFLALSLLPVTNISEFMMRPRTFAILEDTVKSARSAVVQSPVGPAPVYPPAVRIEFFLKPPLEPPLLQTSRAYFESLTEQLDNDHFAVGSGRFAVAEVSSSGAFVQADILPPARGESGTVEVGTLLQELAVRASTLNVLGHRFDVRHGLWVQGVDPTLIHEGEERAKLWPVVDDEDKEVVAAKLAAEPRPRPPVSPPPAPRRPPRSPPAPPAPPRPPSPRQPPMLPPAMPIVCSDTCVGRHNGECQDGGAGSIEEQPSRTSSG
ncbi:hypothetical protein AB1Y20_008984 [Prymnesium parvum]|uniref:Uncharacterized protein n=1 Tax=Prymnesium parvum TaxID=97485 RepID=A0AB34K376_PRYPA